MVSMQLTLPYMQVSFEKVLQTPGELQISFHPPINYEVSL